MDNIKDDGYYAIKAIENIVLIQRYIKDKTYEEFMNDNELNDAIMFRLVQLIENIKNISSEFKQRHQNIPWGEIMGFRNGIVHEYGKTDYVVVYETITGDLNNLRDVLEIIV